MSRCTKSRPLDCQKSRDLIPAQGSLVLPKGYSNGHILLQKFMSSPIVFEISHCKQRAYNNIFQAGGVLAMGWGPPARAQPCHGTKERLPRRSSGVNTSSGSKRRHFWA